MDNLLIKNKIQDLLDKEEELSKNIAIEKLCGSITYDKQIELNEHNSMVKAYKKILNKNIL